MDLTSTSVREVVVSTGILGGALLALAVIPSLSAALAGVAPVDVAIGAGAALVARRLLASTRPWIRRRRGPRRAVADGGRAGGGRAGRGHAGGGCGCGARPR